jgi:hypothetical protein
VGAWGPTSFENDWALDWTAELRGSKDTQPVRTALQQVVEHGGTKRSAPSILERLRGCQHHTDWLTARVAARALAAAEVVSAWCGKPAAKLADGVADWVGQHTSAFLSDLVPLAREAVAIVKTNSELKELWEEGDATEWREGVDDLERRLQD